MPTDRFRPRESGYQTHRKLAALHVRAPSSGLAHAPAQGDTAQYEISSLPGKEPDDMRSNDF